MYKRQGDDSKVLPMMDQEKNLGKVTDLIAAYIQLEDEKKQLILDCLLYTSFYKRYKKY